MSYDNHTEDRLRSALHAGAEGVRPDEVEGLDRIRQRSRHAHNRRRAAVAGLGAAAVVVAALLIVPNLGDDGEQVETIPPAEEGTSTTEATTQTTVNPGSDVTTPPTLPAPPLIAVWPPAGHEQYADPVAAATSFVEEYIGFAGPTFGEFREGGEGTGEIDVFETGESGQPRDDVASTISLRAVVEGGPWVVTSAQGDDIKIATPQPLELVTSPVNVSGRGRSFEGNILVSVKASGMGAGDFLAQEPTIGGCCETLEPFQVSVVFGDPAEPSGSVLLQESTGLEAALTDFTAVPVLFEEIPGLDDDVTVVQSWFVNSAGEVVPRDRRLPATEGVLRAALGLLLAGPDAEEQAAGFSSALPPEAAEVGFDVTVTDGTAVVDFDSAFLELDNVSSSASSTLLLRQLFGTVFQFPTVERAEYQVDGSCDAFWNLLQRDCTTVTPTDPGI